MSSGGQLKSSEANPHPYGLCNKIKSGYGTDTVLTRYRHLGKSFRFLNKNVWIRARLH